VNGTGQLARAWRELVSIERSPSSVASATRETSAHPLSVDWKSTATVDHRYAMEGQWLGFSIRDGRRVALVSRCAMAGRLAWD